MNTPRLLISLTLAVFAISATQVLAQRETFDASVVRIIESKEITSKLTKPASGKGKVVERKGIDGTGKLILIIATDSAVTFGDIFFKFDSTELRDKSSEGQLQEMLKALKSDDLKGRRFLIEAHCCDLGGADYNLKLSGNRAQAIKDYLVKHGIATERLATLGCGETEPAVKVNLKGTPAEIELQRSRNRRVVLRQLPDQSVSKDQKK